MVAMKSQQNQANFSRRIGAFASATFMSRILGYARDSLVASYFGGGLHTDAFYAAFKIPNLLRRFLGEGSLTAAFVPVLTETEQKRGREEAQRLFNALASGLTALLSVVVVFGIIFAPQVTQVISWGFVSDPEKFALTTLLTRLMFPFLLLICLAALVTAVLNSRGRFFTPALAPAGLSVAEIGFILFVASRMSNPIEGLAISAVVGAGLHLVWQLPALFREKYTLKPVKPFSHPSVKTVFLLMGPTVIGLCSDQVNSFVDQFCASFLAEGSITALYNSNRIMQLPLALFGVAVSSVALPALSDAASRRDEAEYKNLLNYSLRIANFVLIPSSIGLAVLALPIVQVLFEHGRFTAENSLMTCSALIPYAVGLPAYSAIKILASGFYANKNTKTPVRIAFQAMAVNVFLDVALMWKWGVAGLAVATAVSSWYHAWSLFHNLKREIGPLGGWGVFRSFLYGLLAGCAMGAVCWLLSNVVLVEQRTFIRVFGSIGVGVLLYLGVAKLLKIKEYDAFMETLLRRNIGGWI